MNKENKNINTPYDDVFRTLLNDCPRFIIAIINEAFGTTYSENESVIFYENEKFLNQQDGQQEKRITDSNFDIGGTGYHIECQSWEDSSMILRVWEYDSQIAKENAVWKDGMLEVSFPNTAVLYLRHTSKTPDYTVIKITVPGDSCSYKVPNIKVKNYNADEILEKKLYFLIPFHIFRFENKLEKCETDKVELEDMKQIYLYINEKLEECQKEGMTLYERMTLQAMARKVIDQIARKYPNVKKGLGDIMGGKVLEYEAKIMLNKGKEEGKREGEHRFAELVARLLNDGLIDILEEVTTNLELREQYYLKYGIVG